MEVKLESYVSRLSAACDIIIAMTSFMQYFCSKRAPWVQKYMFALAYISGSFVVIYCTK